MAGLAETIKDLREEKGWSRRQLARRADVSEGAIRNAEKGSTPYAKTIRRLAKGLGVTAEELTGDDYSRFVDDLLGTDATPLADASPETAEGLRVVAESGSPQAWFEGELPQVPQEVAVAMASLVVENQRLRQRVRQLEGSSITNS